MCDEGDWEWTSIESLKFEDDDWNKSVRILDCPDGLARTFEMRNWFWKIFDWCVVYGLKVERDIEDVLLDCAEWKCRHDSLGSHLEHYMSLRYDIQMKNEKGYANQNYQSAYWKDEIFLTNVEKAKLFFASLGKT